MASQTIPPTDGGASDPIATPAPDPATPVESSQVSRNTSKSKEAPGTNSPFTSSSDYGVVPGKYFRSRRIKKGEVERPYLRRKDPREFWVDAIPIIGFIIGLAICGLLIWDGVRRVAHHKYCEVLNDNFTSWDDKVWTKEVEVGGFGNGQFEMTTNTNENVWVKDGLLIIKPTLQDEQLIERNTTLDLRGKGCTGRDWTDCVATTNTTNGTIVNPVRSGRINTKLGASIKFGRVEVTAKLPAGDWLWPAIWMLPTHSKYGEWPKSGEIDIAESRGNNRTYAQGGNDIISSTLHFGPDSENDGWWVNNVKRQALHTTFSDKYHTFGLEWTEKYIFTYLNTRLLQVAYTHFAEPFWEYGQFPLADRNGSRLENPWAHTGSNTSPFDQDFYLVLNVGVGGTNGWFKDGKAGKPWIDRGRTAKKDFWQARHQWHPTWEKQGWMEVKNVKILQQAGYNGCK
ncbi:concanavalin A-like lectin/glucanase domain-containing protein [Massariosphaeria phaeospora]|uniref:Concanavalin A-like lectin/glucanase domain-containing protein n=1 Tax=Massariosphaeria phaeospora TaxID=100035 RepID=A0A7C8MA22_9PLEO|nr:concanavalin A-like lectin/glucanase domain-containing protein [Massariosphaeria phaeospora]